MICGLSPHVSPPPVAKHIATAPDLAFNAQRKPLPLALLPPAFAGIEDRKGRVIKRPRQHGFVAVNDGLPEQVSFLHRHTFR